MSYQEVVSADPALNGYVDPSFALEQQQLTLANVEQELAMARAREADLVKLAEEANAKAKKAEEARLVAEAAKNSVQSSSFSVPKDNSEASSVKFNKQLEELNKKYEEVKNIAREGRKKGEVAKHSKPQIKRSIGFIFDIKFGIEDLKESMDKLIDSQLRGDVVDGDILLNVKDKIEEMEAIVENEMEANEIASVSRFGWGTVKYYENYSCFVGKEDAEKKSQRFYQAEGKARANYSNKSFRGFGKGRGKFHPYNNSVNNSNVSNSSNNFNKNNFYERKRRVDPETVCFKCNLKGHMKADCPKN